MAAYSLGAIAEKLGGELTGDPTLAVERVREPAAAGHREIAVLFESPSDPSAIAELRASAVVVPHGFPRGEGNGHALIRVGDPRAALAALIAMLHPERRPAAGTDPAARVSPEAELGPGVYVGPGACVERGARLGAGTEVHAGSYVGEEVEIGEGSVLHPNVTIYAGTRIGRRVRIHAGTVVGSDGFGFPRGTDGSLRRVPQVGTVVIEDDVEIGANCAIDRATLETTRIGRGTKIDNLVQVGHNAELGKDCCIMGQVGLSGSVRIGDGVTLAGQVGVADHVRIPDGAAVGAQAGVVHDIGPGRWVGSPALPAPLGLRVLAPLREASRDAPAAARAGGALRAAGGGARAPSRRRGAGRASVTAPPDRRVVVTGVGLVTPLGGEARTVREAIARGETAVAAATRFDAAGFGAREAAEVRDLDCRPYLRIPKALKLCDAMTRFAVVAAARALADGGMEPGSEETAGVGVIVGASGGDFQAAELSRALGDGDPWRCVEEIPYFAERILSGLNPLWLLRTLPNMTSAHVAIQLGARGPNSTLMTDWVAGLQAVGEAALWIRGGEADAVLAGGADTAVIPFVFGSLTQAGVLGAPPAPRGSCRRKGRRYSCWKKRRARGGGAPGSARSCAGIPRPATIRANPIAAWRRRCGAPCAKRGGAPRSSTPSAVPPSPSSRRGRPRSAHCATSYPTVPSRRRRSTAQPSGTRSRRRIRSTWR